MPWSTCAAGESSCQRADEAELHSRPRGHGYAAAIQLQRWSVEQVIKKPRSIPYRLIHRVGKMTIRDVFPFTLHVRVDANDTRRNWNEPLHPLCCSFPDGLEKSEMNELSDRAMFTRPRARKFMLFEGLDARIQVPYKTKGTRTPTN